MNEILSQLPIPNLSFWLLEVIAILLTAWILPGLKIKGPIPALMTVILLAFVNSHIWSAALFFKIPDSLSSQMLTLIVSNALLFWIIAKLLPGIEISGIVTPLIAPILFSVSNIIVAEAQKNIDWNAAYQTTVSTVGYLKSYLASAQPTPK